MRQKEKNLYLQLVVSVSLRAEGPVQ